MNWLVTGFLAVSPPSIDEDALHFLQTIYEKAHSDETDCLCSQKKNPIMEASAKPSFVEKSQAHSKIKIFMSFSVPLETWLDYSKVLEKLEGVFILRGLPENSFDVLARKLMEFRKSGINAPIQIDPEAFDQYDITAVPTLVIEDESGQDKIAGNIRLDAALRLVLENGSTQPLAKQCLEILANQSFSNVGKTPPPKKERAKWVD